jgi:hypothetical protein
MRLGKNRTVNYRLMKKIYILSVLSLAWLGGCSGKPMESVAREHLIKSLNSEIGNAAKIASFRKTGATEGVLFGVKFCDVEYSYELLCSLPVPVKGLRRYSRENVILLDEFFKAQTEPWEKLDFTPILRIRLDGETRKVVADSYAMKKSLFFCKPGQKVAMTGKVRLMQKDNGWTAE